MFTFFRYFLADDDGAVTVDWVVLCAAIVGLTVLISTAMTNNALGLADGVSTYMAGWAFN